MRVVQVLRKLALEEWGGTETHVADMTRALVERGWSVEVHAPDRRERARASGLDPRVPVVRYRAFLPMLGLPRVRRALRANAGNIATVDEIVRLVRDPQIALLHLHTLGRVGGAVRTAARARRRPYVVSIHGPLLAPGALQRSAATRHLDQVIDLGRPIGAILGARRVLDDAARVIVFNDEERRAIGARIGATRTVRMDHGIDCDHFAGGLAARATRRWPELGRYPLLLVVGRICRQKNQLLALRAFADAALGEARLALAGAVVDEVYAQELADEAVRLGIADRVHLLGNIDRVGELPHLLARASLVLLPSAFESFGLAVLEAWAAGRAVVFAGQHGLADLARALAYDAAVCATLERDEWAATIRALMSDEAARDTAARAGQQLVHERFSVERIADELARLYRDVIAEAKA